MMRKTKIVCTIGPATDDDDIMRRIMQAGMNVARFNFSHGDYETHQKRYEIPEFGTKFVRPNASRHKTNNM